MGRNHSYVNPLLLSSHPISLVAIHYEIELMCDTYVIAKGAVSRPNNPQKNHRWESWGPLGLSPLHIQIANIKFVARSPYCNLVFHNTHY